MKPLCVDLFCGLGGWAEGFLAEGYEVIGFDIERHRYPRAVRSDGAVKRPGMNWSDRSKTGAEAARFNRPPELHPDGGWEQYPGQLVLQDVLTLHGSQFRDAACIVASPPCQEFSYMAMPWKRGKQIAAALRGQGEFPEGYRGSRTIADLTALFDACFRIQREASEAAGRHIPMVVENVRGAQPWVGQAKWGYGSYYLWGDVPAIMPFTYSAQKHDGSGWRANRTLNSSNRMVPSTPDSRNVPGMNFHDHEKTGKPGRSFQSAAVKVASEAGRCTDIGKGVRFTSRDCGVEKDFAKNWRESPNGMPMMSSHLHARKAASALIAKIPFKLAAHIARVYYPRFATQRFRE